MLDVGETLDKETDAIVSRMGAQSPRDWAAEDVARITRNPTVNGRGVPSRLSFGTTLLSWPNRSAAPVCQNGVKVAPSYARGGDSVVWGGAVLPVSSLDMDSWPISRRQLEPSFARVSSSMPLSATVDDLSSEFPLYSDPAESLKVPQLAKALLESVASRPKAGLDRVVCGQARLAVQASPSAAGTCVYCGLCLSGCVKGAIYDTRNELDTFVRQGVVEYRSGELVLEVAEDAQGVSAITRSPESGSVSIHRFDRIFVAAGAINSTRILLSSRRLRGQPVELRYSPKFLVPLLHRRAAPIDWPDMNALAAVFLEMQFPDISRNWIHAQVSVVNDLMLRRLRAIRGGQLTLRGRMLTPLLQRLMVAWCGLHSDEALPILATLLPDDNGANGASLELRGQGDPTLNRTIRAATWRLARHGLGFKTAFLAPFRMQGEVGEGSHIGGSLPMRALPEQPWETDLLGRPAGWSRIHFVDGSVLPSIPATTICFTIMANADRIGTETPI